MLPPPPRSTLFPYTTLFRSSRNAPQRSSRWQEVLGRPRGVATVVGTGVNGRASARSVKALGREVLLWDVEDRKSTRLNSSHGYISYAVFCLKKKKKQTTKCE